MQSRIAAGMLVSLVITGTACQPDTITAARDQLARGGNRTFNIAVPITADTFTLADFLSEEDTTTTSTGVLGVPVDSHAVNFAVGQELSFSGLAFDNFTFGYDQMLSTSEDSVTVSLVSPAARFRAEPLRAPPANGLGFHTANGSAVEQATIASGWFVREVTNGTACSGTVSVTATDSLNSSVVTFPDVFVPANSTVIDSVDASGSTMNGFIVIGASATPVALCVPVTGTTVDTRIVFRSMTLGSVTLTNLNEPFTATYAALASEGRVQAVDTIVAKSGSFTITAENRLPITMNLDVELAGVFSNGTNATASLTIPAAPGDGSTVTGTAVIDLAGDTLVPSEVVATVNGVVVSPRATVTSALVSGAVVVNAGGNLDIQTLIGPLDPAQTPELVIAVQDFVEISAADFDFGEFEDAIRDATIRQTDAHLTITNGSNIPLELQNFVLAPVRIDPLTGQPMVDAGGDYVFETDATGAPLTVLVADPGSSVFSIPRSGSASVTLELARVANRLVNLSLDGIPVAIVGAGSVVAGDASPSRIDRPDSIELAVELVVGLDISLPVGGVSFQVNNVQSGADFSAMNQEGVSNRVIAAGLTSRVTNGAPFGLQVEVAYVDGDRGDDFDVFSAPDRIEVTPLILDAPTVDAAGRATGSVTNSVDVVLTGGQIRQLMGEFFSSSVRVRLLPGAGGGGRGAVRPTDQLNIGVRATLEIGRGN